ncbi:hypothetical protein [Streptomyces sp. NPDC047985]
MCVNYAREMVDQGYHWNKFSLKWSGGQVAARSAHRTVPRRTAVRPVS